MWKYSLSRKWVFEYFWEAWNTQWLKTSGCSDKMLWSSWTNSHWILPCTNCQNMFSFVKCGCNFPVACIHFPVQSLYTAMWIISLLYIIVVLYIRETRQNCWYLIYEKTPSSIDKRKQMIKSLCIQNQAYRKHTYICLQYCLNWLLLLWTTNLVNWPSVSYKPQPLVLWKIQIVYRQSPICLDLGQLREKIFMNVTLELHSIKGHVRVQVSLGYTPVCF